MKTKLTFLIFILFISLAVRTGNIPEQLYHYFPANPSGLKQSLVLKEATSTPSTSHQSDNKQNTEDKLLKNGIVSSRKTITPKHEGSIKLSDNNALAGFKRQSINP